MSRDYVLQSFNPPVNLHIDYAAELNPQQLAAVTAPPGPSLVIAGAGSGKTRTLTYRVGFLLEQGIPADRILLLTFTNKAAKEMMRRVGDLLEQDVPGLWGGTFHGIGNRILRIHAELLGYQKDFNIMDRDDAEKLIGVCIAESEVDVKATRFPKAEVLADIFSKACNTQTALEDLIAKDYDYFLKLAPQIAEILTRYTERKRAMNAMDFDDLLFLWLRLMREHSAVCDQLQRRFQFILVDEYQDTNALQSELIDLLAARNKNIMVVGDDAQSIYAWRGANFLNILKFPERYPDAKVYKIETNYRSTPEVLNFANAAIRANLNQFEKQLSPARKSGVKPVLAACMTAAEQSAFVAQRILELRDEGVAMNNMAVLYRSHFHALELQLELTRRNIPFNISSGMRFFDQAHIKDVTAHIKFVHNSRDELSFKRIAQLLPGIGGKGADKLWLAFASRNAGSSNTTARAHPETISLANDLVSPPPARSSRGEGEKAPTVAESRIAGSSNNSAKSASPLAEALQSISPAVPKKALVAWTQYVATISQLETAPAHDNPSKMILLIVEAGYQDHLRETYDNHALREEDLEHLAVFARQFANTQDFLAQLALLSNLEAEAETPAASDDERVRLSTIHQAKGLEFDVVFIIMLCDGMFPSSRSLNSTEGEEEERRLLYVAVTRARNELYLSYPLMRLLPGVSGDAMQQPSRFISEIPKDLYEEWNLRTTGSYD
jgi:DNA helicase-2/ATP-dependent DNA helicase PcrA